MPVLALRDVDPREVPLEELHPVRADVDPSALGIPRDHRVGRPDVPSAVQLVMDRHGELEEIDRVVLENVLEDRSLGDCLGRDRPDRLHPLAVDLQELHGPLAPGRGQTHGKGEALR